MIRVLSLSVAFVFALGLSACGGGGSKCSQVIDKAMTLAEEMMTQMAKQMGGDAEATKKAEEEMAKAKKELEAKKPEALKKCEEALKNDKELEKTLDCIIAAKGMEEVMKCEGADKLGSVM
jgi:hypothetical protein